MKFDRKNPNGLLTDAESTTVYVLPETLPEVIAALDPFQRGQELEEESAALAGYETEFDRMTR